MNKVSFTDVKNAIEECAFNVTWKKPQGNWGMHMYTFTIANTALRQKILDWIDEHKNNWAVDYPTKKFTYMVKSDTDIALILQGKVNPCLEIKGQGTYEPDCIYDQEWKTVFIPHPASSSYYLVDSTGYELTPPPNEEIKMHEIKQQYTIGATVFEVPNRDLNLAEAVLMKLSAELVALKADRKKRKKVFEDGLPLILEDKYDRETSILLESISLLDEITELEDGF
jgi:hypothetical protein